jgi:hypothetical protein
VKSRDFGSLAVEKNSAQQFRRECWVPSPIQRHLVFFVDLVTWVGKPLRQFPIVCEEKQTLSLRVQPPDVEEAGKLFGKQIKDSVAGMLIFSGGNKSGGFIQYDGKCRSGANKFAIDFDVIARVRLCAEVCADFTVNRDATRCDQFITMSPRTDPSGSKEAIETQSRVTKVKSITSLQRTAHFNFVTCNSFNGSLSRSASHIRLRFRQANDFTVFFPLAALLQKLDALEAFQHIPPSGNGARSF